MTHQVDGGKTARIIIRGCHGETLGSMQHAKWVMKTLCHYLGMKQIGEIVTRSIPPGMSVGMVIAESHMFLHTWPESDSVRIVIDSCVDFNEQLAAEFLADAYETRQFEVEII
jgi:S-adenosylmethionine/arginine decarboxylase-like enzyme